MRHYHNILYVNHGTTNETEGLKQALSLARNNDAPLKVLVIGPAFPEDFPDYRKKYEETLLNQAQDSIKSAKAALKLAEGSVNITVELENDDTPSIKIIQQVLRHGHDLVVKEAEPRDQEGGFKAIDMDLLRKCPVPVWLCHPIKQSRQEIRVAVAIDPKHKTPETENLSKRMLEIGRSLADSCNGVLNIISCWDYAFEEYLHTNMWLKTPDSEIKGAVEKTRSEHLSALEEVINASGIEGESYIRHLRGAPEEMIPNFVQEEKIDILIMGTVARTGIPGFLIGNTSENIVQNLTCSLMALKPQGFISPVKAYE